ncbi:MAG: UDP-N-acetylmuramate dehydrogenase [Candidatus Nanopelagicaceae bacterium]
MSEELRNHTTLRVGGPANNFVRASNEAEIIAAIEAAGDQPILILGSGSNVLISDTGFPGTVIQIANNQVKAEVDACSGATLNIGAGENWDDFVKTTIDRGWAGLETLSGIPGTVGAAPIQNIGAYGHEVSEFVMRVRTYDRQARALKTFTNQECQFTYRDSVFKKNPGRYVVLEVQFNLRRGEMTSPITYAELATELGIQVGEKADVVKTREAVLRIRARKGMLLDNSDKDTFSAGSFFTNPIVSEHLIPEGAPKFAQGDGTFKTSAAWLIEQSGICKGQKLNGAAISSKHVLAITNSGDAKAADIAALAMEVKHAVKMKFGIDLIPEVNLVGISLR